MKFVMKNCDAKANYAILTFRQVSTKKFYTFEP